jgi:hypothetical protein
MSVPIDAMNVCGKNTVAKIVRAWRMTSYSERVKDLSNWFKARATRAMADAARSQAEWRR